jgi:Flp pilus assembly pilin Flp
VEKPTPVAIDNRCARQHYLLTQVPRKFVPEPGGSMMQFLRKICTDDQGQDIAEYAVMLAVILVLVIGTVRLIGGNANNAFSTVASTLGTT